MRKVSMTKELPPKPLSDTVYEDLKEYLRNHETDIYLRENDFEELFNVFVSIFGREPELKATVYERYGKKDRYDTRV